VARTDYPAAEQHYHEALTIFTELRDRQAIGGVYHQLGVIAGRSGDYDAAGQQYQAALTIFDELGDRASIAAARHGLGLVAERHGDYDTAEQQYRAALVIQEEIGRQADMVLTLRQLGILLTEVSRPADAVGYQLQSLAIRAQLGILSNDPIDLQMLREQRTALGDEQFLHILQTLLNAGGTTAIMELTGRED